jgi:Holliday junction DNA helicase RuvB
MGIDHLGLDESDHRILGLLVEKYKGKPVGLSTLAASLDGDTGTIEDVNEPWLLKLGLIDRTPRGRVATDKAREHLEHL